MKKILATLVALALVLSLTLVVAAPVTALSDVSVSVSPAERDVPANYTVSFKTPVGLGSGYNIYLAFNTTLNFTGVAARVSAVPARSVAFNTTALNVTLNASVGAGTVTVTFNVSGNPTASGVYSVSVHTDEETVPATGTFRIDPKVATISPRIRSYNVFAPAAQNTTVTLNDADTVFSVFHGAKNISGNYTFDAEAGVGVLNISRAYLESVLTKVGDRAVFNITFNYTPPFPPTWVLFEVLAADTYDISLTKDWNLISLPLIPVETAIAKVLAGILPDVIAVWNYDAATKTWRSYPGPLTTMEAGKAYWINMRAAKNLTVTGTAMPTPPGAPPEIFVVAGWNMVGFTSTTSKNSTEYLTSGSLAAADIYKVYGWTSPSWVTVAPGLNMTPGSGYWVAFAKAGVIYP